MGQFERCVEISGVVPCVQSWNVRRSMAYSPCPYCWRQDNSRCSARNDSRSQLDLCEPCLSFRMSYILMELIFFYILITAFRLNVSLGYWHSFPQRLAWWSLRWSHPLGADWWRRAIYTGEKMAYLFPYYFVRYTYSLMRYGGWNPWKIFGINSLHSL